MQPRGISVSDAVKSGRIEFNSSSSYTVGGINTLSLETTSGDAVINVIKGSHSITAPLMLRDDTVIVVKPEASNLSISAFMPTDSSVTKEGAGELTINNVRAAELSINSGTVAIAPNGDSAGTSVVEALSIRERTTLDLTNNALVIDYTGPSPVEAIRQQIRNGRGGPGLGKTWNGEGITSSAAAAAEPESRSTAYADNSSLPLGQYSSFRGHPVDDTAVLVAYTRTGDANLDGVVNDDDVTIVGATYLPGVPQPHWALGDFDYDGFIDEDDVTLLGVFYDPSAVPVSDVSMIGTATPVPEPASLLTLVLGCLSAAPFAFRKCRQM